MAWLPRSRGRGPRRSSGSAPAQRTPCPSRKASATLSGGGSQGPPRSAAPGLPGMCPRWPRPAAWAAAQSFRRAGP
eukprot:12229117-Alexandrium_andersonii.AAC.1